MPEIWTLVRFSFKEAVKKKVAAGALLLAVAYIMLYGYGLSKIPEASIANMFLATQMFSMALFGGGFIVALLAVMTSAGAVAGELETGTIYAVLTKPLTKNQFLLGKFLGYGLLLVIFSLLFFLALWGTTVLVGGVELPGVLPALGLFIMQPLVMLSVTFLASTLLSTMAGGVIVFMLYGIAFIGGMIEQIGALVENSSLVNLGIISSLLLPADALYRLTVFTLTSSAAQQGTMGAMRSMGPFSSVSVPSSWMVLYAAAYIMFMLFLALRFFKEKDI